MLTMCRVMNKLLLLTLLTGGIECMDLTKCMQPDNVDSGDYDDPYAVEDHVCTRKCVPGDCRTCYYRFVCERYTAMNGACKKCPNVTADCYSKGCVTADGWERSVLCINRRIPAPSIQVCKGDHVVIDVKNLMAGQSIAIHWHGLRQINHKFMDGVPMVTQCPILESEIFRYHYSADYPGSHFYHSHSGTQKMDGIVGCLVIRQPDYCDPNRDQYDYDYPSHCIVIQDWKHECADCLYPGIQKRPSDQEPDTFLIQGHAVYLNKSMPMSEFKVHPGKRHLMRFVGGTCFTCQFKMTIEKHWMTIVGADGQPTKPYKVKSITCSPGERWSVVVHCNQKPGAYWMQVKIAGPNCVAKRVFSLAILRYIGYDGPPPTKPPGFDIVPDVNDERPTVNPIGSNCSKESEKELGPCVSHLRSARESPKHLFQEPCKTIVLALGFHPFANNSPYTNTTMHKYNKYIAPSSFGIFGSTMNGRTYELAPSPLLSQWRDVPRHVFCRDTSSLYDLSDIDTWNTDVLECVQVIKVPTHCVVKMIVLDATPFNIFHPFHLHGYDFCVVECGILPNRTTLKERVFALKEYLKSPKASPVPKCCPLKDTIMIPAGGYCVLRIYTDNPGFWYFHCHFGLHLESGMAGVMQVGEYDEMPCPPKGFPRCGDYLPILEEHKQYCQHKPYGCYP